MLGGQLSNQDEEDVEEDMARLEREVQGIAVLPEAPNTKLTESEATEQEPVAAREPQAEERRQAVLTS